MKFLYFSKLRTASIATPSRPVCARYRERPRCVLASLCGVLAGLIVSLCVFLISLVCVCALTSCTRHHYSIIENKSVSLDSSATKTTDTLRIYVRDSISQKQVRDTVYIEKFRIVYRDRTTRDTIYKNHRDTVFVSPQDIENHTKIVAKSSSKIQVHKIAFWFILIVLIILVIKFKFKNF